jgi:hypothetical protein
VHLAEEFWGVNTGVAHVHVVTVPNSRAGSYVELAAVDLESVNMPERVLTPEAAVLGLYVGTLLDGTLAIANRHFLQSHIMSLKERAFTLEMLFLDSFHLMK